MDFQTGFQYFDLEAFNHLVEVHLDAHLMEVGHLDEEDLLDVLLAAFHLDLLQADHLDDHLDDHLAFLREEVHLDHLGHLDEATFRAILKVSATANWVAFLLTWFHSYSMVDILRHLPYFVVMAVDVLLLLFN